MRRRFGLSVCPASRAEPSRFNVYSGFLINTVSSLAVIALRSISVMMKRYITPDVPV